MNLWTVLRDRFDLVLADPRIENLAAFRSALLALDREVTGGKLPGLVSWERVIEAIPADAAEKVAAFTQRNMRSGHVISCWQVGTPQELNEWAAEDGWTLRAYLPLRVEDALLAPVPGPQEEARRTGLDADPGDPRLHDDVCRCHFCLGAP